MAVAARRLRPRGRARVALSARLLDRLMNFPAIRKAISKGIGQKRPLKVDVPARGEYVHFRLEDPKRFEPGLFATISIGRKGTKAVIGTPKAAVKKRAALRAFLRQHARAMRGADRRSLVYQLRKAGIIGGSRAQSILVPKARVEQVVARFVTKPQFRKLAGRANPLDKYEVDDLISIVRTKDQAASIARSMGERDEMEFYKGESTGLRMAAARYGADKWTRKLHPYATKYQRPVARRNPVLATLGFAANPSRRREPLTAFDVFLRRRNIDTVFYSPSAFRDYTITDAEDEVRQSLIQHDGYDPGIRVRVARRARSNPAVTFAGEVGKPSVSYWGGAKRTTYASPRGIYLQPRLGKHAGSLQIKPYYEDRPMRGIVATSATVMGNPGVRDNAAKGAEKVVRAFLYGRAAREGSRPDYKAGPRYQTDGQVLLQWGNLVAKKIPGGIQISDAGWRSKTTMALLNVILGSYSAGRIFQKKGQWFLQTAGGTRPWLGKSTVKFGAPVTVEGNPRRTAQQRFGPCPSGKVRSRTGSCVKPIGYRAKKGKLYGWHAHLPAAQRHAALERSIRKDGWTTTLHRLQYLVNISADQKVRAVARQDAAWMDRNRAQLERRRVAANATPAASRNRQYQIARGLYDAMMESLRERDRNLAKIRLNHLHERVEIALSMPRVPSTVKQSLRGLQKKAVYEFSRGRSRRNDPFSAILAGLASAAGHKILNRKNARSRKNPCVPRRGKKPTKRLVSGARRNAPVGAAVINIPFRDGQKVKPSQVRQWLASLPNSPLKTMFTQRFEQNMKQYRKFHLGAEPKTFIYKNVPMGASKRVTDVDFVTSEGKEWAAPYQVPKHSKKYAKDVDGRYLHSHGESGIDVSIKRPAGRKQLPERFHTADGKFVGVVPSRNVTITDWYRG